MFEGWDNFYLIIGGASGGLIGLMFVVATLGHGRNRDEALRGTAVYMTPTVVNFTVVLVSSALVMAPRLPDEVRAGLLAGIAGGGLAYACITAWRFSQAKAPHWSDAWCYGYGPPAFYAALAAASSSVASGAAWAPVAVATAQMALLLLAIRNAWDLVTWLAPGGDVTGET